MLEGHIKGLGVGINGSYEFQFAGKLKGTGKNGLPRKLKHEIAKKIQEPSILILILILMNKTISDVIIR